MPQSKVFTDDRGNRLAVKSALKGKVEAAMTPPPPVADKILLLPSNYKDFPTNQLQFILVNNTELKHTPESARLAIDVLTGLNNGSGLSLQAVEVENLILPPTFADEAPLPKQPAGKKTSVVAADSTPIRDAEDKNKRENYRQKLAQKAAQSATMVDNFSDNEVILLLPSGYDRLSSVELYDVLAHTPTLKHTPESAVLALEILGGKEQPANVKFEVIDL